jgi:hypothetical protein
MLILCKDSSLGMDECTLDLGELGLNAVERERFEKRWPAFLESDAAHPKIYRREGENCIVCKSETFVPTKSDDRLPLLFLLGNPASHSVLSGMCFSFEGSQREHRFWRAMRESGILSFESDSLTATRDWMLGNEIRKKDLFELNYSSPFRIGIAVYFSMPSGASSPAWSGVAGLRRLFGKRVLELIALEEQKRIAIIANEFLSREKGIIVAFQRDAYEGIRSEDSLEYILERAKDFRLVGQYRKDPGLTVIGVPPTRFLSSRRSRQVLSLLVDLGKSQGTVA